MASSDSENSFHTASSGYPDWEYESASAFNGGNMSQLQPYLFDPRKTIAERWLVTKVVKMFDDRFANLDWHV